MKHTPITDEYAWGIKNIISELEKLYEPAEYYDYTELNQLICDYRGYLVQIHSVKIIDIRTEFWEICQNYDEIPALLNVYRVKFRMLSNWRFTDYIHHKTYQKDIRDKSDEFFENYKLDSGYDLTKIQKNDFHSLFLRLIMRILIFKKELNDLFAELSDMDPNANKESNVELVLPFKAKFRLASKRKTDFIKVISAMYDAQMFEMNYGMLASNKQELMNEFGRVLGVDLGKYSASLSLAKKGSRDTFLNPFKELERKAGAYYDKTYEQ